MVPLLLVRTRISNRGILKFFKKKRKENIYRRIQYINTILKKINIKFLSFSKKNEFSSYAANCETVVFTLQKDLTLLGEGGMTLVF